MNSMHETLVGKIRIYSVDKANTEYDFNGVVHLMLAAMDNLRANALEAELEDIGLSMDENQRIFFQKIARSL